ncbi:MULTISPECIES: type 3 dihydrofolate reductase [Aliiglaciecola]|nr:MULTISPECIES: type 3 dihydrofolate reductase [Aliiglaciecola]MBU2878788.1 type 3 dihydrofolate reductase [Aliiglaciecola lipolytica]MDO6711314.1 type 3 dihydrofolate reductase [Aliiglaciecola sp. 2_MG-2023]MDO6752237.1 type 3 dihydrofolate reductase [Aliiglaciecola sp. 1_MG-2023]
MIAAMAKNRVIGADNSMPWHLPADLGHFKRTTLGKPVVMGRKTYESIGKALPGRLNIVISRDSEYQLEDAIVVSSCEDAVKAAGDIDELMIIGGGTIYSHFLPLCHRLYLTQIDLAVAGDTYFPDYNQSANWEVIETESHLADEKNKYNYQFLTLNRVES